MHHRAGKQFRQAIQQVLETNSLYILEYSIPGKSAEEFYEARFVPVLDNQIIVIARNITERKKAEEELALRAQLLNAANDSIVLHDFAGKFVFVNEAACSLYGYSKDELLQKNINDLNTPESAEISGNQIAGTERKWPVNLRSDQFTQGWLSAAARGQCPADRGWRQDLDP